MSGFICVNSQLSKLADSTVEKIAHNAHAVHTTLRVAGVDQVPLIISRQRIAELVAKNLFAEQKPQCPFMAKSRGGRVIKRFEFADVGNEQYQIYYWSDIASDKKPVYVLGYMEKDFMPICQKTPCTWAFRQGINGSHKHAYFFLDLAQIIRTYKRKLKLSKSQEQRISSWIGACRVVYNLGMEIKQAAYKSTGKSVSKYDLINQLPDLKKDFDWIRDVTAQTLQAAV